MSNLIIKRESRTPTQKAILKRLIDHDLTTADVARFYGHTTANASIHLLRQNEYYFDKAIKGITQQWKKQEKKQTA